MIEYAHTIILYWFREIVDEYIIKRGNIVSKEDDVVEEAVDALSQEPVPEIKPYYYQGENRSLEDMKSIQKRYDFIIKQYLGRNFKAVVVRQYRTGDQIHFTIKHKRLFHWWSFTSSNTIEIPWFNYMLCKTCDDIEEFMNFVDLLITVFKTKEINA